MREYESKTCVVDNVVVRSILERKWALFFKYLKIKFIYEPERFQDGTSVVYLPDFLIHDKLYIEIKPSIEIAMKEIRKSHEFVKRTDKRLLLAIGNPPGDKILAIVKQGNNTPRHSDVNWMSWNTLTQKQDIDIFREKSIANFVANKIDVSLATPIARCLKDLGASHRIYKPS